MATLFDPFDPLTGERKYQSDHVVNSAQFYGAPLNNPLSQNDTSRNRELHYAFLEETNNDSSLQSRISSALKAAKINASPIKLFEAINGFTISISPAEAERLEAIPTIRSIEADRPLSLTPPVEVTAETNNSAAESSFFSENNSAQGRREIDRAVSLDQYYVNTKTTASREEESSTNGASAAALPIYNNGSASTGEILPYGVKAVWGGSDISTKGNAGSGTYAIVIDSGVLDTTGDLIVNKTWSKSWVSGETAFTDGNGHGTHVAGTIAALANGVGVVGVAPGAEVISLKVFNSAGGGASYSTIIDAVNYATQVINSNGLDKSKVVINMSLGGGYSAGMDAAVKNAANQGIKFSIAAGNSGADADGYSPASAGDHANIYTVSAVDNQYQMSSWSNWDDQSGGDDVDVAAPGVSVLSYYKGGQLANLSGTSMAAPHVAGLLLMGGVKEGDMVTANWAGEPDPFALASNGQPPTPPTPPPAPIKPPTKGLIDDFSGGQTASFWKSISLGAINNNFTGRRESLFFTGSGTRSATTKTLDLDQGATISFDLTYGTDFNGGEEVDSGEEVALEYSSNGSSWTTLKNFDISSSTRSWGKHSASLSADLATGSTQLRWRQKTHSSSNWDEWAVDNISIKDKIEPTYSEVEGKYIYGNGDYYFFSGIVTDQHGGGTFSVGQKIYATDNSKDAFDQAVNETGNQGYYLITSASNKTGVANDSVRIGDYYDSETRAIVIPHETSAGTKGLGSESAYLTSRQSQADDLISNYHEADHPSSYWEVSGKYFYGNGDYYSFSGFINDEHTDGGLSANTKIYSGTDFKDLFIAGTNETGHSGYYKLDSAYIKIGSTTKGIAVNSYYDSESLFNVRPNSFSIGLKGLGSESGFLTGTKDPEDDFFNHTKTANIAIKDVDNNGFVDNWATYRLTDGSSSIQLRNSRGKTYSDASTKSWDASKAVQSGSGWKVLLDGDSRYQGKFSYWDVNASGTITKGSSWKTTDQALEAGWESIFGDVIKTDGVTGISATDTNSDGFVDNWATYRLTDGSSSIQLRNSRGKTYSDASTKSWDASKAVQSGSGWKVLLDGDSRYQGKFSYWDVSSSGTITKGSSWKTTDQALDAGWESIFGDVIKTDGVTGISATDTNSDGFVDNWATYRLTDGSSSIQLRNSRGKTYSDASTKSWDASKAVQSGSGWKVLLDGDSRYQGKFSYWDVNASGTITKGSSWKTTDQALDAGWESIFGDVIKTDGVTGISATDTNSDGFVDNWATYRLTDGSSSIQLRNSRGKTYSDASTKSWDASKAVQSGSGWKVLLDGDSRYQGKFSYWDVNASGTITKGSSWKTTDQALEAGWESIFGDVIKTDGVTGISATDTNSDGFVDNWATYRLTDGSSSIQLRNSRGKTYSDASTKSWDASKAVQSGSGWKVLLDGDSRYQGKFSYWDVSSSGTITKGSSWKTTDQALDAGWESIFGDVIKTDGVTGISATDTNSDGFVDNWATYRLTDGSSSIQLRNSRGKTYSDASTKSWDASKAVQSGSGWKVLLDGDSRYQGKFSYWDVNASGTITKGSSWKTTDQALDAGWESIFGDVIKTDGVTGISATDTNSDGFVDNWATYRLTDGSSSIQLRNSRGKTYSDASTKSWDASKAVQSGSGWKVLLDGDSRYQGKFSYWDVNASGTITKGSSWKTTDQALDAGWESIFGDVIKTDGVTGISATDTNSDGFVDNWATYRLTDGSSSIQLRNKKGKTYSDSSSKYWDASKAVQSGSGWKVLLDGDSRYQGKFSYWDVNASGTITKGSSWKTTDQALDAGWESIFGDVISNEII